MKTMFDLNVILDFVNSPIYAASPQDFCHAL